MCKLGMALVFDFCYCPSCVMREPVYGLEFDPIQEIFLTQRTVPLHCFCRPLTPLQSKYHKISGFDNFYKKLSKINTSKYSAPAAGFLW